MRIRLYMWQGQNVETCICVKSSCAQPAESVTDQWCLKEKIKEKQ